MTRPCVLLFGASARFRDGRHGQLTGVLVEPNSRTVAGLDVTNHLGGRRLYVPAEPVTAAFPDGVHVNLRSDSIPTGMRPGDIQLIPNEPVWWQGAAKPLARLKGVIAGQTGILCAFVLGRRPLGPRFRLDARQIIEMDQARILVRPDTPQLPLLPRYRTDDEIQVDVLREIELEPRLLDRDLPALRVEVTDGAVHLGGNVCTPQLRRNILQRARRVAGVLSVTDELIEDRELEVAIAAALTNDPATRRLDVYVFARTGEVELAGELPSQELAEQAVLVASRVPGVRSVKSSLVGAKSKLAGHQLTFER